MANEVVIDGKLMSLGRRDGGGVWRPDVYHVERGGRLGLQKELGDVHLEEEQDQEPVKSRRRWAKLHMVKKLVMSVVLAAAYNIYLVYALHFHFKEGRDIDWCGGLGFLIILTVIVYCNLFYFHIVKRLCKWQNIDVKIPESIDILLSKTISKFILTLTVVAAICVFLVLDTADDRQRLVSAGGIVVIVTLGAVFSKHRTQIIWRHVTWGLSLQFAFGLLILRWGPGKLFFECIGSKVDTFLGFTDVGSSFVFGFLVNREPFLPGLLANGSVEQSVASSINAAHAMPAVVVFKALSTVYFFSFLVSMLFYWGVLQWFVVKIGWLLQVTIGPTAVESLNAAANIFLGQAQSPFLIKPYLGDLTKSEIHAVMTGGFATIAGTVLAAYISFGVSAAHLVSASVMSAPAALAYAKLFYPETEKSKTRSENIVIEAPKEANVLDAATQGASSAGILVVNITAIVVAFIAFMAFLNSVVAFLGDQVGISGLSFDIILGKIFIPLTFCMGVEWDDCEKVSRLLGLKTVLNEFIAYRELGKLIDAGQLSQRSIVIATYALCGFANPGSIGVQLATLSSMAPSRKADFAGVAFRAFVSGSMACFLTACIAGALYDKEGFHPL